MQINWKRDPEPAYCTIRLFSLLLQRSPRLVTSGVVGKLPGEV